MTTSIELSEMADGLAAGVGDDGSEESDFSNDDGVPNPISYDDEADEDGAVMLKTVHMDAEYVLRLRRRRTVATAAMVVLLAAAAFAAFFGLGRGGHGGGGGTSSSSSSSSTSPPPSESHYKDKKHGASSSKAGRRIKFYVDRLDGEDGRDGEFTVQLQPTWAPIGVKRFEELTEAKFWDGCRIFRVVPEFVSQWGINGDPDVTAEWKGKTLEDDKAKEPNERGTVTFATSGEDSRTTQVFVNTGNNLRLNDMGFSPVGMVVGGMDVVDRLYGGYGEGAPNGDGPDQGKIEKRGNKYLDKRFPKLSYITKAEFTD